MRPPVRTTPRLSSAIPTRLLYRCLKIACLPDERHVTGPRCASGIVDEDRVYAGRLDVHHVAGVDIHDVSPCLVTDSHGHGRGARPRRFKAGPIARLFFFLHF